MKKKIMYLNDKSKPVTLAVGDFHNMRVLHPQQSITFEMEVPDGDGIFVKSWDNTILISTVDKEALCKPTSQTS